MSERNLISDNSIQEITDCVKTIWTKKKELDALVKDLHSKAQILNKFKDQRVVVKYRIADIWGAEVVHTCIGTLVDVAKSGETITVLASDVPKITKPTKVYIKLVNLLVLYPETYELSPFHCSKSMQSR